jgi:hypothetical protein
MPKKKGEEQKRLNEATEATWYKWGTYVSERSWGTVREDYSPDGEAWSYFPHDLAIRKSYRWGEDGIAGFCDRYQVLVFAPAFWNGHDPILKERLFGLSSPEGNHGEDVKEYYYHLDATPTHSYMKFLYKYPQEEFPYQKLREENQKRTTHDPEYELVDTGIFSHSRYFDIFIEYAKANEEDLCIKIEAFNRGDRPATLHILPTLWFRNQWGWEDIRSPEPTIIKGKNCLIADDRAMNSPHNLAFDYHLGKRFLYGSKGAEFLFTNNETHHLDSPKGYYKDAFHRYLVKGESLAVNPDQLGTKACLHYAFNAIPPQGSQLLYLRLTACEMTKPLEDVEKVIAKRKKEADLFYEEIHPPKATKEEKAIQRQALAGMLWNKQIYLYDVDRWLKGDNTYFPPPSSRYQVRNQHWRHLISMRILAMPDKWEYSYFCAWDQAFHCLTLGLVDLAFAKEQLWLLLFDQFQHPNGQIPACEWEFSDLNPPVQGWSLLRLYEMEKKQTGKEDLDFLERCFHKLLMNFSWWVNKVDSSGNNVFEGGFLGLDNITLLDRSQPLPGGVRLQQSDGTGWMAMFCLNLMRIALILAKRSKVYESLATKFFEHYIYIAHAMKKRGNQDYEMWSDRDGFFYDVLTYPNGLFSKFRVRSLVGLIPLYAVDILEQEDLKNFPEFRKNFEWFITKRKDLVDPCIIPVKKKGSTRYILTLMNQNQLQSVLRYVWDPNEFRSPFGLRSLSKYHEANPFVFRDKEVGYEPAESFYKVKGGNSNWRGPVWVPMTFLLVDALKKFAHAYENKLFIAAPGEKPIDLNSMADSFSQRLFSIFTKNEENTRPFFGPNFPFKHDPHWRDYLLFYEYFHPETGQGLGASHQSGWTALIANLIT